MEIRPVEGEGCDPGGYVVEVLGHVEFRRLRHEACEAAFAVLENEIDRLRQLVYALSAEREGKPRPSPDERESSSTRFLSIR